MTKRQTNEYKYVIDSKNGFEGRVFFLIFSISRKC